MKRFVVTALGVVLLELLAVPRVEATPIRFTFQGTVTGALGDSQFTAAPFTIIATGDTANIVQASSVRSDTRGK